jgi:hypothetical protein
MNQSDKSFNNYNLFLVSIGILFISLVFNGIFRRLLLLLSIILLIFFSYYQYKLFDITKINDFNDAQIILSNLLFAIVTLYLCFHIFRHHIIR